MLNSLQNHNEDLVGVVLAGGRSQRLGIDKRLICLHNSGTLLDHALGVLRQCVGSVAVSCRVEAVPPCTPNHDIQFVPDALPDGRSIGPLGALYSCLCALQAPILVVSCDLPFITAETLRSLLTQRIASRVYAQVHNVPLPLMTTFKQAETGFIEALVAVYEVASLPFFENALQAGVRKLNAVVPPDRRNDILYTAAEAKPFFNVNYPADLEQARQLIQT